MSLNAILADAATVAADSRFHEIVIGAAGTLVTAASSVAAFSVKSLVKKVDQLTKALIDNQQNTLKALQAAQHEQTELLQASHSRFVETMDGTIRENTHALTAITVQLGIQSREMQRMEQTILKCPGAEGYHKPPHYGGDPVDQTPEQVRRKAIQ